MMARGPAEHRLIACGGVALLYVTKALEALATSDADQKFGVDIVRKALQAPVRQIAQNAGFDGSVIVGKLLEQADTNHGFNAQTGEYGDMFKFGVIDPTKVVRAALQDAASIAGLLITTEAMIAEKPAAKSAPAGGPGGMGGMGDMDF